MDTDLKKIKRFAKMMKKEGLLNVKIPELELTLAPAAVFHEEHSRKQSAEVSQTNEPEFTEEEMALWSAPGYSNLPSEARR